MKTIQKLKGGYEIREMTWKEFEPLWGPHVRKIFDRAQLTFFLRDHLTEAEKKRSRLLSARIENRLIIYLGLFQRNRFVGWCFGCQEPNSVFYMQNSAILASHRKKGLYSALAKKMIQIATDAGFQHIYSRHMPTNNAILIAKLKLGFKVTGLELSDIMGTLVHLSYFPKKIRNQVLDFRCGLVRPNAQLKRVLKLG